MNKIVFKYLLTLSLIVIFILYFSLQAKALFSSTVFQTVLSGVAVFLLGQIIKEFVLNPLTDYKKVVAKIDNELKYYSNIICNNFDINNKKTKETIEISRRLSCELESSYKIIGFNELLILFGILPREADISKAGRYLIFISNSIARDDYLDERARKIDSLRRILKINRIE